MNSIIGQIEQRGRQEGRQLGEKLGEQKGIKLGRQEGIKLGEQKGIKLGEHNTLLKLVEKGIISKAIADQMLKGDK